MFAYDPSINESSKHFFCLIMRKSTDAALTLLKSPSHKSPFLHGSLDLNVKNDKNHTMLHEAAELGLVQVCEALLNHKDFMMANERSKSGSTALHYAAVGNHASVCKLLLEHDQFTATDVCDNFKSTPMHDAASLGHIGVLQVLLADEQSAVMIQFEDALGKRPIDVGTEKAKALLQRYEHKHQKKNAQQPKTSLMGGA